MQSFFTVRRVGTDLYHGSRQFHFVALKEAKVYASIGRAKAAIKSAEYSDCEIVEYHVTEIFTEKYS